MSDDLSSIFGTPATALGGILSRKAPSPARQDQPEAGAVRTRPEEAPPAQEPAAPTAPAESGENDAPAVREEPEAGPEPASASAAPERTREDHGSAARTAPPAKERTRSAPAGTDRSHATPTKPKRPAASRTAPAAPAIREPRAVRPAPRPQPVRTAVPVEDLDVEVTSQLSVYVLPEAVQAIRRARESSGRLNAEIAFDAIDSTQGLLQHLVEARQVAPRSEGSLFPARRAARRGRRRISEQQARTLWTIQITQAEYQVLKDLVAETGADSVSQLVSAAIEAYLLDDDPAR
ncbi:hypothetical protein ACFHYQ_08810 [Sphaerimonospora cavernae]|uniref:Ribbon-helix-helix protein CopG domain-containing protein n=1 Tax=Sphaerimonospora cavernae TaxID=1740611 RepID=A0ABV6U1W2_9ACTN